MELYLARGNIPFIYSPKDETQIEVGLYTSLDQYTHCFVTIIIIIMSTLLFLRISVNVMKPKANVPRDCCYLCKDNIYLVADNTTA